MLLSEIFNEKYEFEEVSVKEDKGVFKVVNGEKIIMDNLGFAEAVIFAQKLGKTVYADYERYYQEQLDFVKGNFCRDDK